jgi:thiamine-monophosphate kinase
VKLKIKIPEFKTCHVRNSSKKMLENTERTELTTLGEFGLIKHLTEHVEIHNMNHPSKELVMMQPLLKYNGEKHTLVSTDMLVEGVHFDLTYVPLKHLGYKSIS